MDLLLAITRHSDFNAWVFVSLGLKMALPTPVKLPNHQFVSNDSTVGGEGGWGGEATTNGRSTHISVAIFAILAQIFPFSLKPIKGERKGLGDI